MLSSTILMSTDSSEFRRHVLVVEGGDPMYQGAGFRAQRLSIQEAIR
jgi:precorrin-6B methylase 1